MLKELECAPPSPPQQPPPPPETAPAKDIPEWYIARALGVKARFLLALYDLDTKEKLGTVFAGTVPICGTKVTDNDGNNWKIDEIAAFDSRISVGLRLLSRASI